MGNYVSIEAVKSMQVSPDGLHMVLTLSAPPDELLSAVISGWKYHTPPGLKGLRVQDDALVVDTELDPDAPSMALRWLYGGDDPALAQMQEKVREMEEAARGALVKAQEVFNRPV